MRFYLASWLGDGTTENEYRPNVEAEAWAAIDLRPDSTRQEGRVLVATSAPVSVSRDVLDLGEDLDGKSMGTRNQLARDLSLSLDADTLRGIIAELLILHGENLPRGSRSRWGRLKENRRGRHVIFVLGEKLYDAPAPQGTTITDDFNRSDGAIGSSSEGWSWAEVDGDVDIVSNQAEVAAGSGQVATRAESDLASDDHYAQATVLSPDTNAGHGLAVRFSDSALTAYVCWSRDAALNNQRIGKVVAGSKTSLALDNSGRITGGEVMKFEVDGSTLTKYLDTVETQSTTDTDITGNTRAGLWLEDIGTEAGRQWDDFEAADLAAGGDATVTPGVTGLSATLPAASPTAPAATNPAATSAGLTIPAASTAGAASVSPSTVTSSAVIPQVSLEGPGSVSPAASELAANLLAVTTATGGSPGSVSPSELAAQLSLPSASPAGAGNVTPAALSAALSIPGVTAEGLTVVSPAALESAVSLGQVTLVGGATVTVDALELEVVFGVPVSGEAVDHPTGKTSVDLDASTTDAGVVAAVTSVSLDKSRTFVTLDKTRTDT